MNFARVILFVSALTMAAAYGQTPKPMTDNVLALTEAAAILNICFERPEYDQLDSATALQLHGLGMRLTSLAERIAKQYDDEGLYLTFELMRVKMSSDPKLHEYARKNYQYCGPSLFEDMGEYVAETESQIDNFLSAGSPTSNEDTWPKSAKSAYIKRCTGGMSSQGLPGATARAYCTCMTNGMEREFGMREYDAMMRAQPNPQGSQYDRRLFAVFQLCSNLLPG